MNNINTNGKKIYFASDQHFGIPSFEKSREREILFVKWLDTAKKDAAAIFLLGDLFDFWFEYKTVVPKGFIRVLGKIAEICDNGIPIYFFVGNHDLWMKDYFEKELGVKRVFYKRQEFTIDGKIFLIGHGDGLGPNDKRYKRLKKIFTNPLCKWLFARLHPNFSIVIANYFSNLGKNKNLKKHKFLGEDNEWLALYSKRKLEEKDYDYFIFGHRHLPMKIEVSKNSFYFNSGEWITKFSYLVFENGTVELCYFK